MDPTDPTNVFAGGSDGVVRSTDGGLTWQPAGEGLTDDTHFVEALVISASGVPYAGTWYGVCMFVERPAARS